MTVDEINALPERVRAYVHDLETRCDPSGDVQRIASLTEQRDALVLANREQREALTAIAEESPDGGAVAVARAALGLESLDDEEMRALVAARCPVLVLSSVPSAIDRALSGSYVDGHAAGGRDRFARCKEDLARALGVDVGTSWAWLVKAVRVREGTPPDRSPPSAAPDEDSVRSLGCDCYPGCWGDHSKEWPSLTFGTKAEAGAAYRSCFAKPDPFPYGSYVLDGLTLRLGSRGLMERVRAAVRGVTALPFVQFGDASPSDQSTK